MGFEYSQYEKSPTDPTKIPVTSGHNTAFNNKSYMMVPYVKGMGESCKDICRKHGIEMHFKGGSTIKDLLVNPMDRHTILQKSGVINRHKCSRVDCEEEYIGESGRTLAERFREHMRVPSPIHDHHNTTGHDISIENLSIVGREVQSSVRSIKEAILIRVNDPTLNRNIGKYQLPHIWMRCWSSQQHLNLSEEPHNIWALVTLCYPPLVL